jgi:multidrug efflux pump subunit AcrB
VKRIIFAAVHNPLIVNVTMLLVILFGLFGLAGINREMFPSVVLDQISVRVPFPGASALEVEEGIILKLEEAIEGIPDIDEVNATATDNMASMLIVLKGGADLNERTQDVKNAVDGIIGMPADAEIPIVSAVKRTTQVISLVLYGNADLELLRQQGELLKEELKELEVVSLVEVSGTPERQIAIEVSEAALRRYDLSFDEISSRVRAYSLNSSGGSLKTSDEEMRIRIYGRRYTSAEYAQIPLRVTASGAVIHLSDVADVREDWEDIPTAQWYQGKRAVRIEVNKTDSEDSITIVKAVKAWMTGLDSQLPDGVRVEVLRDSTISLKQRIELLVKNGVFGLILVGLTLTLFLNVRLSFWVAMGIPISYAGMFFLFGFTPATINVISLFGMILVLGIVVDDAIVVGENIFQHVERGATPEKAALEGAREVAPAVVASVLTTQVAFIPFFFIEGRMGLFIWQMALAVILALSVSLVESLFILPPHLAHSRALKLGKVESSALRKKLDSWIDALINGFYARTLRALLKIHWVTVSVGAAALLLAIGLIASGRLPFTFFPRIERDNVDVTVKMTPGTREARTLEVLRSIEEAMVGMEDWLQATQPDGQKVMESISVVLGPNSEDGSVQLTMLDSESRSVSAMEVTRELKKRLPVVPDAEEVNMGAGGRHFGLPVSVRLMGQDIDELDAAVDWLKESMRAYPALTDIQDDRDIGKRELKLRMRPEGEAMGLSLREVARQVRQAFYGEEILRFQRGYDEIKVWTRLKEKDRASIEQLKAVRVRTPAGRLVPFGDVVEWEVGQSLLSVKHFNGKRVLSVSADIDEAGSGSEEAIQAVKNRLVPEMREHYPGVKVSWGGEQQQQAQSGNSMKKAFPMAIIIIGFILVVVFRSLMQTAIVLGMIPLGLVGAVLGHMLLGKPLTILSVFGLVGLSGIIINDSVVFVDRINREIKDGASVKDAVYIAGLKRFRAIMLTTVTTVMGMLPIILETSRQAQFLIPMAISISFGLLFGTFFTVYILPSVFLVLNDVRRVIARVVNWLAGRFVYGTPERDNCWIPTPESVEPVIRRPVKEYKG